MDKYSSVKRERERVKVNLDYKESHLTFFYNYTVDALGL